MVAEDENGKINLEKLKTLKFSNKYRRDHLINEGAYGRVYKMMRLSDDKFFAAKFIPIREEMKVYLERELYHLKILKHKNIVKVVDEYFITREGTIDEKPELVILFELAEKDLQN